MAKQLLSLMQSEAVVEQMFSATGRTYTPIRNQMSVGTLQMLIVVRDYVKSEAFNFDTFMLYLTQSVDADKEEKKDARRSKKSK